MLYWKCPLKQVMKKLKPQRRTKKKRTPFSSRSIVPMYSFWDQQTYWVSRTSSSWHALRKSRRVKHLEDSCTKSSSTSWPSSNLRRHWISSSKSMYFKWLLLRPMTQTRVISMEQVRLTRLTTASHLFLRAKKMYPMILRVRNMIQFRQMRNIRRMRRRWKALNLNKPLRRLRRLPIKSAWVWE